MDLKTLDSIKQALKEKRLLTREERAFCHELRYDPKQYISYAYLASGDTIPHLKACFDDKKISMEHHDLFLGLVQFQIELVFKHFGVLKVGELLAHIPEFLELRMVVGVPYCVEHALMSLYLVVAYALSRLNDAVTIALLQELDIFSTLVHALDVVQKYTKITDKLFTCCTRCCWVWAFVYVKWPKQFPMLAKYLPTMLTIYHGTLQVFLKECRNECTDEDMRQIRKAETRSLFSIFMPGLLMFHEKDNPLREHLAPFPKTQTRSSFLVLLPAFLLFLHNPQLVTEKVSPSLIETIWLCFFRHEIFMFWKTIDGDNSSFHTFGRLYSYARTGLGTWLSACTSKPFLAFQEASRNFEKLFDHAEVGHPSLELCLRQVMFDTVYNYHQCSAAYRCFMPTCTKEKAETIQQSNRQYEYLLQIEQEAKEYKVTKDVPLQKCARCHLVRYCCRNCQLLDWKHHKKVCKK